MISRVCDDKTLRERAQQEWKEAEPDPTTDDAWAAIDAAVAERGDDLYQQLRRDPSEIWNLEYLRELRDEGALGPLIFYAVAGLGIGMFMLLAQTFLSTGQTQLFLIRDILNFSRALPIPVTIVLIFLLTGGGVMLAWYQSHSRLYSPVDLLGDQTCVRFHMPKEVMQDRRTITADGRHWIDATKDLPWCAYKEKHVGCDTRIHTTHDEGDDNHYLVMDERRCSDPPPPIEENDINDMPAALGINSVQDAKNYTELSNIKLETKDAIILPDVQSGIRPETFAWAALGVGSFVGGIFLMMTNPT